MHTQTSAPHPAPETARGPGAIFTTSPPHAAPLTPGPGADHCGEARVPDTARPTPPERQNPPAGARVDRHPLPLLDTIHALLRCVAAGEHYRQTGRLPRWAR